MQWVASCLAAAGLYEAVHLEVEDIRLFKVDRVSRFRDSQYPRAGEEGCCFLYDVRRDDVVLLADDEKGWHIHVGELCRCRAVGAGDTAGVGSGRVGLGELIY